MYAATIRHRDGVFHVICEYLGAGYPSLGVIFTSADPFDERTWSDPVTFPAERIDPDLFWDDDGRAYVATQGVVLQEIDLATSALSQPPIRLWNGTGGASPEGPHLYRKDGYLLPADRRRRHGDEPLDHDGAGAGPEGPVRGPTRTTRSSRTAARPSTSRRSATATCSRTPRGTGGACV